MSYFYLKPVIYEDIPAYEKLGWRVRDESKPSHHCFYAKIMKWEGEGEPVEPENARSTQCTEPKT